MSPITSLKNHGEFFVEETQVDFLGFGQIFGTTLGSHAFSVGTQHCHLLWLLLPPSESGFASDVIGPWIFSKNLAIKEGDILQQTSNDNQ